LGETTAVLFYQSLLQRASSEASSQVCTDVRSFLGLLDQLRQYRDKICRNTSIKSLYINAVANVYGNCMSGASPSLTPNEFAKFLLTPCPCWALEAVAYNSSILNGLYAPVATPAISGTAVQPAQTYNTPIYIIEQYKNSEPDECNRLCLDILESLLQSFDPNSRTIKAEEVYRSLQKKLSLIQSCSSRISGPLSALLQVYGSQITVGGQKFSDVVEQVQKTLQQVQTSLQNPLENSEQILKAYQQVSSMIKTVPLAVYAVLATDQKTIDELKEVAEFLQKLKQAGIKPEELVQLKKAIDSRSADLQTLKELARVCQKMSNTAVPSEIPEAVFIQKLCGLNKDLLNKALGWTPPEKYLLSALLGAPSGTPAPPSTTLRLPDGKTLQVQLHSGLPDDLLKLLNCEFVWQTCEEKQQNSEVLSALNKLVQVLPEEQKKQVVTEVKDCRNALQNCTRYYFQRLTKKDEFAEALRERLSTECRSNKQYKSLADQTLAEIANSPQVQELLTDSKYTETLLVCDGEAVRLGGLEKEAYDYRLGFAELWKKKLLLGLLSEFYVFRL